MSRPLNVWVDPSQVVDLCRAVLVIYRDNGLRLNRQKSRLMWLLDEWGLDRFRHEVETYLGSSLAVAAPTTEVTQNKRDLIGIHAQKQPGLCWAGLHIPVGRLNASEMLELSRLAEVYGTGELRLTVEQNVLIPHVPTDRLEALRSEPLLAKFSLDPSLLRRGLVSCTGNQFCNLALIETKNRAVALITEIEQELDLTQSVRIHWSGCPNSCGQPIGLPSS